LYGAERLLAVDAVVVKPENGVKMIGKVT